MRRSIFALSIAFSLIAWNTVLAQTPLSTTIAGNVTWTKAGGPYLVSYVGIPAGATLTIEPGTVIKVTSGAYPFWVDGTLTVGAQNSERVTITSEYDNGGSTLPNPGDWRTIMLDPGAIATFTNTDIRYGSASVYNGSGGQDYLPIITNAGGTLTMDNATLAYGKNAGIDT